jgi:hypothetical protein
MTDIIVPDQKLNIVLDISKFDTFRTCEQKYWLRYLRNKQAVDRAKPLDRGTLVHLAAETYYTGLQQGIHYQDAVVAALSAVRRGGMETDLDIDEVLSVIDTMEEYFDFWRIEDQGFQIIDVEKPFMYMLHEAEDWKLYLSGKIDLIISDNQYTNLPWDHKSYDRNYPVTRMPNQFKNYVNALSSDQLVVNRIGFQKTLKAKEKFLRVPLSYDRGVLDRWKLNVIRVMDHYVSCLVNNEWPMNETSCDKYNRKCEYFEVCDASDVKTAEYKLATLFIDGEPWDVTKSLMKTSEAILQLQEKNNE